MAATVHPLGVPRTKGGQVVFEVAPEVADRVVFLADGDIVADGATLDVLLSSPAFAPQVAKVMSPAPWLTVKDALRGIAQATDTELTP